MVISSYELLNEVSDEKRFRKKVTAGLREVRNAAGDGLFTVCSIVVQWYQHSDHASRPMFPRSRRGISHVR